MHTAVRSNIDLATEIEKLKQKLAARTDTEVDRENFLRAFEQAEEWMLNGTLLHGAIMEDISDLLFIMKPEEGGNFRCVFVNPSFARITGIPTEQVIGRSLNELIGAQEADRMRGNYTRAIAARQPLEYDEKVELLHRRYEVHTHITPVFDSCGQCIKILGVSRDVTEIRQMERSLRKQNRRLHNILDSITDAFITLDREWRISYLNPRAEKLLQRTKTQMAGKNIWEEFPELTTQEAYTKCLDACARQNSVEFEAAFPRHSRWFWVRCFPSQEGVAVYIQEVSERRHAEQQLKQGLDKVKSGLDGIVNAMAIAVEMRDPYTAGHQRRVSALACAIARQMQFPPEQIETLRIAGLLHDVGKISIPSEILNRPGQLSDAERTIVRTHARIGYDILKGIEFSSPVALVALQHHERLDGSGYPQGLKNEDIIAEARILAVADVVEAMASHRPYRPALGVEQALKEVLTFRGSHYDEMAVEACLSVFTESGFDFDQLMQSEAARRSAE